MKPKKNFYVVKVGRQPGLYHNWDDCFAQVTGFSGAVFKGFAHRAEADEYAAKPIRTKHVTTPTRKGHYRMSGRPRPPGSNITNPRGLTQFYSGARLPWEFPIFMECYET
jgi:viroplasmin and RNaseH domain-containing protein